MSSISTMQVLAAQKFIQNSLQMTQIPIPLNVVNSYQNTTLQKKNSTKISAATVTKDDPKIYQVWYFFKSFNFSSFSKIFHLKIHQIRLNNEYETFLKKNI